MILEYDEQGRHVVIHRAYMSKAYRVEIDGQPICGEHDRSHRSLAGAKRHASAWIVGKRRPQRA